MNSKLVKIAVFGAISAIAIDYFFKPTLGKTMGLR